MASPINTVDGTTLSVVPAVYEWSLSDVSDEDAGRTQDGTMHKNRIGSCVQLHLEWHGLTTANAKKVLTAFQKQYISVNYLDPLNGGYRTANFYVGDRTSPLYNATLGLWENISFDIIERKTVSR